MTKGSFDDGVVLHAGFPNAAEDEKFGSLSLDDLLVKHRASTFFWRLENDVTELMWRAGNIVVVDRALDVKEGNYVVAVVDDDFLLCQMKQKKLVRLDDTPVESEVSIWGIATHCIQPLRS